MEKPLIKLFNLRILLRLPTSIKYRLNRIFHEKLIFKLASKESVFTSIWRNNYWGNDESLSGPGSTIEQTENLKQKIPNMFDEMVIKSVFDAPCGDMHWMQHILKDAKFTYLGGDIVGELVCVNKKKFENTEVTFIKFDITADAFPTADVWVCRHLFFHLSNRDIYLALEQFVDSNIKYILTTNCVTGEQHINKDIITGNWRPLNLNLPPFNFPRDFLWEVEDCAPPSPAMTLTLWTKAQIESILPSSRKIFKQ